MSDELDLVIRPMTADDQNFIVKSWALEYAASREIRHYVRNVLRGNRKPFFDAYCPTIQDILGRSTVLIASLRDVPTSIVGFAVLEEPNIVHYVYVKARWRRLGVATRLVGALRESKIIYSHVPRTPVTPPAGWEYQSFRRFGVNHDDSESHSPAQRA